MLISLTFVPEPFLSSQEGASLLYPPVGPSFDLGNYKEKGITSFLYLVI